MLNLPSVVRSLLLTALIGTGFALSGAAYAQSATPVTATCKDGSSFSGKSKRGACAHHGGVKAFTEAEAPQAMQPPVVKPAPAASAMAPITKKPASAASAMAPSTAAPATMAPSTMAPSTMAPVTKKPMVSSTGGSGQVWVNTVSKVYHCPNTRYHGKTNSGEYMSEAAAKAKGYRPSRGKECT